MITVRNQKTAALLFGLLLTCVGDGLNAQDMPGLPTLDFTATIKPIIETRCATCHNGQDEEAGLDLTDTERLLEYITVGNPMDSGLYQSLVGTNDFSVMPPEEDNEGNPLDPCTNAEKAMIYLWIQQGASLAGVEVETKEEAPQSPARRIFLFSGYFHPAVVHFPIALITMSAVFIVIFFRIESLSDDAAYYLLLFGALASVVACVFGWAFAERNPVESLYDISKGINRHRWFGIAATIMAVGFAIVGWRARNEVITQRSGFWKFGVILTAALMGVVGHQGGEEVYGEGVYERAAQKLIPEYWPFGDKAPAAENEKGGAVQKSGESGETENDGAHPSDNKKGSAKNNAAAENTAKENANESDASGTKTDDPKTVTPKGDQDSDLKNEASSTPPADPTIKADGQKK